MKVRMIDDVVWRELADEVVLLNPVTGVYFGLDGTGGKIWRVLANHGTTEAAADAIAAEYDANRERIEADIARLVGELRDKGLIEIEPDDDLNAAAASFDPPDGIKRMAERIIEHHGYLNDRPRMEAYARAIAAVVKPGDVVMDLGAGTGVFGVLAARAGARKVYSVDCGGMIEIARMLAKTNDVADRFVFLKNMSTDIHPDEPVDVVIADQAASFVFQAGVFKYFADARRRFLKPGGRFIPFEFDLMVAPVERGDLGGYVALWRSPVHGVDVSSAVSIAANDWYETSFATADLMGPPATLTPIESSDDRPFRDEAAVVAERNGTMHGIGGFFRARLAPGIEMSSSPLDPSPIARRSIFFPIERPIEVDIGDRISIAMSVDPIRELIGWTVRVADRNGTSRYRAVHSTFKGAIVAREHMERARPSFKPLLSPLDAARRTILELCDGKATVAEIEAEVARRHSGCCPTSASAASLVARVLDGCELGKSSDDPST